MRSPPPHEASRKATQRIAEKLGDFLREVAALVLVFIPLDLWRDRITGIRVIGVLLACAILFMFGLWFDIFAMNIKRVRQEIGEIGMTEGQVLVTTVAFFGGISSLLLGAGWSWLRRERKRIDREHKAKLAREQSGLHPA